MYPGSENRLRIRRVKNYTTSHGRLPRAVDVPGTAAGVSRVRHKSNFENRYKASSKLYKVRN